MRRRQMKRRLWWAAYELHWHIDRVLRQPLRDWMLRNDWR